jgi:hypothetical protein
MDAGLFVFFPTLVLLLDGTDYVLRSVRRAVLLTRIYGSPGIALFLFGNRSIWRLEAQIIGKLQDADATAFKDAVQGQCSMISVAVRAWIRPTP